MSDSSRLIGEAIRLLRQADSAWKSAAGILRSSADEALLEVGRRDFHALRAGLLATSTRRPVPPDAFEVLGRFWATSTPWRVRVERLQERLPRAGDYTPTPDLRIVNGDRWWVTFGKQLRAKPEGKPASLGLENLEVLLRPSALVDVVDVVSADEITDVSGSGIRLHSLPTEQFVRIAPGLVVLSASEYTFTIDARRGIVTDYRAYIGEDVARRVTISELVFDRVLDSGLFTPPTNDSAGG